MPRSEPRLHESAGFTLVEILVVVALIAILVSIAATGLRIFESDRSPEVQARRLAMLFSLAGDEAIMTGTEVGMRLGRGNMQFYRFVPETREWVSLAGDLQFRDRELPVDMSMQLVLEGFEATQPEGETDASKSPQVIFFSSGEATPFHVEISMPGNDESWLVQVDLLGQVEARDTNARAN